MSMIVPPFTEAGDQSRAQQLSMDRMYRFQRHIYDASRRFYLLGRERLIRDLNVPEHGTVLEIGCGTGRNLVKVAKAYPTARVFGFDISDEMLKSAANAIHKADLRGRVRIAQGDALSFDGDTTFGVRSFDRVYFSYTLSMIPQWKNALEHAAAMLSADGELHAADFGQCEKLASPLKVLLFAWLRKFHVWPCHELAAEFRRLAQVQGGLADFADGYGGYSWHLVLSRCKPSDEGMNEGV